MTTWQQDQIDYPQPLGDRVVTRILSYEAAESFLDSWNAFEQATGKTVWVDTFWKRAKPWRVEMRRREVQA